MKKSAAVWGSIFGFFAIFLSIVEFLVSNNTLALTFPWRTSVILIPLSTTIILSYLISKISLENNNLKSISIILFILFCSFFFIKNHFIENSNKDFYKNLDPTNTFNPGIGKSSKKKYWKN